MANQAFLNDLLFKTFKMQRIREYFRRVFNTGRHDINANVGPEELTVTLSTAKTGCCNVSNQNGPGGSADMGLIFHDYIIKNNVDGCRKLLDNGLDPNKPFYIYHKLVTAGSDDLTTSRVETRYLHMATIYRRPDVVEALLEAGACPTTTDSAGRCPLQLAITYWPRVRHAAPLVEEDDGRFQAYLDNQHTRSQQTFNLLLNAGAKVNVACGDVLDTMLHLAARYNIKDSVRQLVQHGAELVEAVNEQGDTALCLALKKGTRQVADELIECGALVNTQDALGRTPLHYCCLLTSAVETVTNLLRHGAVTDVKDWEGNTPLHLAAKAANHSMAIQLTQANATVDVLNNKGQNPLFLLLDNPADKVLSSKETVDVLLESSLFIRLVDLDNNLPTSLRIPNVPRELRQLLEMQSTAPPSLYKMALHKTRRCLGFKNTSNIGTLELDCPPGLKDQIAWNWKKVVHL